MAATKNIIDFANDAAKNKKLRKEINNVAKKDDPKILLVALQNKGYEDVSLADCKKVINISKREDWENWAY